jgi:thioredoxin 2
MVMSDARLVRCPSCGATNRLPADPVAGGQKAVCGRCKTTLPAADARPVTAPLTVSDATFAADVEGASLPVLVDMWAPWCGPCRMIAPAIDQLAAESQGRYKIGKLNVDENPLTASRYQIASIPTMLIFRDGQLVDRLIGLQSKQAIAERLRLAARSVA